MQAYSGVFARVYNLFWADFADQVAPRIVDFYESTLTGKTHKSVLDLCCGTGQLALHFLRRGYRVIGIDLSEDMLHHARANAASHLVSGQAEFVKGDATRFALESQVGLVTSTYDSLNHLENLDALRDCFKCVFKGLVSGGFFIFDLNTRRGLMRWNNIRVTESADALVIVRGIYDGQGDRAITKISGFARNPDGLYERFDMTVFNTVFELRQVKELLLESGWAHAIFTRVEDLNALVEEPEKEGRVFVVARK